MDEAAGPGGAVTEVVIIVPARNEEDVLGECLESLVRQSAQGFELGVQWRLILVDDGSTDATRRIAEDVAAGTDGFDVLTAPATDLTRAHSGFNGKTNACWAGAQAAIERFQPKWLLFTDADTVQGANSVSRAMREAEKHDAAMLSYSPRQLTSGFWQRTVTPLIFSELASVYPQAQVSARGNRLAAANGQFLLIEREAYTAIGGHRAVGPEILEDVALAKNLKRSGKGLRFRYAPEMVATRMYRTFPTMLEGWSKNLALLFPSPVRLAIWRALDLLLLVGLPVLAFKFARDPVRPTWVPEVMMVLWLRAAFRFYSRVARAHAGLVDSALSILGIPLFVYLVLRSVNLHRRRKEVPWKGRVYPVT